jgi:hypothetical protein
MYGLDQGQVFKRDIGGGELFWVKSERIGLEVGSWICRRRTGDLCEGKSNGSWARWGIVSEGDVV